MSRLLCCILLVGAVLCGCTNHEGNFHTKTQGGPREYELFCIDGVAHYRDVTNGYVFPAFGRDGKVKLCNQ